MSNEKTVIIGSNKKPLALSKEALQKIATKAGFGIAGVAGGIGVSTLFMGMSPNDPNAHQDKHYDKPDVSVEPIMAKSVNNDMSFGEAFKNARHETGESGCFTWHGKVFNTLYDEEISKLSPEEKRTLYVGIMHKYEDGNHSSSIANNTQYHNIDTPVIVVHDEAPAASHITDDMSFKDAFAVAREEVGPGGIFEWHGKTYNTYTTEENGAMSNEQKNEFDASTNNTPIEVHHIGSADVDIVKIDGGDTNVPVINEPVLSEDNTFKNENNVAESGEKMMQEQWVDDGTGHKIHVTAFLVDGQQVLKVDQDGDGNFDLTMTPNVDGSVHMVSADGQEANLSQEDMMQFQQQMGGADNNNFTNDNINLETDHNAHLSNMEDY